MFLFSYILFFVCFKKKRHGGYANIISSLSLRLAAVPLWLLNSACRDCSLLVVHSNDILYILLVSVGSRTYVRTMYVNISYASEVIVAVCYHLLLEVVDTLSHEADFVVLNSGNEISSHIVFVLVVVLFFIYAAKVLLFFDMCKFLVQKNSFFVSFFQYRTHKRKNATRKHAQKTTPRNRCEAWNT